MRRNSRQRQIILEEVLKEKTHPSAQEIYERVRQRLPKISLGTVYRNLDQLATHGLIQKIEGADGERRFDGELTEHYHVRCLYCGRLDDAALPWLSRLNQTFGKMSDYTILGHRLEFVGICPRCRDAAVSGKKEEGKGNGETMQAADAGHI
jgi:Fur family transcriptional regulator, ferric uptake regulator